MNFSLILLILSWLILVLSLITKNRHQKIRKLKNPPGISVIIPTYNNEDSIYNCVKSVLETRYPKLEIIVVNDGSTDNTLKNLNNLRGKIKIINQKHSGKSAALNHGFRHSKYPILFILDADTFVDKSCLHNLVSRFDEDTGAVTCKYMVANKHRFWPGLEYFGLVFDSLPVRFQDIFNSVFTIRGCGSAISRKAWESVNGFTENLNYGGEDTEMGLKLIEAGWKNKYQPSAIVRTNSPTNFIRWFKRRIRGGLIGVEILSMHWKTFFKKIQLSVFLLNYIIFGWLIVSVFLGLFNPEIVSLLKSLIGSIGNMYVLFSFVFIELVGKITSLITMLISIKFIILILYFYLVSKIEEINLFTPKIILCLILYFPALSVSLMIGCIEGVIYKIIRIISFMLKASFHKLPYRS
ncbi:MAG: glycosyltransferase family 2 protein [Candidatus Aenigmatarchaeota archaeon]